MRKLIILILLFIYSEVKSQTLFEDADGEASLLLSKKSWVWGRFNSSDDAITVGINRQRDKPGYDNVTNGIFRSFSYFIGGNVKVKTNDGIGELVKNGRFHPGITPSVVIGINGTSVDESDGEYDTEPPKSRFYSFYIQLSTPYQQYSLYDTARMNEYTIHKPGFNATVHYNKRWTLGKLEPDQPVRRNRIREELEEEDAVEEEVEMTIKKPKYLILGISSGFTSNANNYDDLDELEVSTPVKSNNTTQIASAETYKVGNFENYIQFPVNLDLAFVPRILDKNIIGFNGYTRAKFGENSSVNMGLGIFFTNGKAPTNVVGGVAWQFDDVLTPGSNKSRVFFYIGYSILSK